MLLSIRHRGILSGFSAAGCFITPFPCRSQERLTEIAQEREGGERRGGKERLEERREEEKREEKAQEIMDATNKAGREGREGKREGCGEQWETKTGGKSRMWEMKNGI